MHENDIPQSLHELNTQLSKYSPESNPGAYYDIQYVIDFLRDREHWEKDIHTHTSALVGISDPELLEAKQEYLEMADTLISQIRLKYFT